MQPLLEMARSFLAAARTELEEGLTSNDYVKVRDAAEKAWNAVVQATDHAMRMQGRVPLPGRDAHVARRNFLEQIGQRDLSREYTYFAERLHGDLFYTGTPLPAATARRLLDEVQEFIDKAATL